MSKPPNPPATQRKSRVLAALDNPAFLSSNVPPLAGASLPPASLGMPQIPQMPTTRPSVTPSPEFDYEAILERGSLRKHKRKAPGLDFLEDVGEEANGSSPARSLVPTREFGLRYDQETAVRSIDRGGNDQDLRRVWVACVILRMEEFVSRSIDNAAHGLTVRKAMEGLQLKDKKDLIPGMEVRLLPHQIIGVKWMVDQERISPHKGGILADEMGLGKTVQMIATMVINQPTEEDNHRTTLIVVPAALMFQWKEEVETKTNGMFDVYIQHGREKIKDPELLAEKDAVITTYHTLNQDFALPSDFEDSGNEIEWLRKHGGPLCRMRFYRVILDEAQFIRNRGTRCSQAVAMLRAKYRWCLTGTPITNTLADIYGYLRFGRFRPWNDWEDFNAHVAKVQLTDARLAGMRAQTILEPIIFRRTKNAKLEGEPILQLPPKEVELVYIEFPPEEREIYDHMEKRAQIQINRFIRNNTLLKNREQVFVWMLRLRQICCHPYLVLEQSDGFDDPAALIMGGASEKEVARATKKMGLKWVNNIKQKFLSRARAMQLEFEGDSAEEEVFCPMCNDFFMEDNGRILACGDEICKDCLDVLASSPVEVREEFGNADEQTNLRIEKEWEAAAAKGLRPCPKCKKMQDLTPNAVFVASAFHPTQEEVRAASRAAKRRAPPPPKKRKVEAISLSDSSSSGSEDELPDFSKLMKTSSKDRADGKDVRENKATMKGKGKTAAGSSDLDEDNSDLDATCTERNGKGKTSKGKLKINEKDPGKPDEQTLKTWEWESTGDKTIVFSQWTSMLDLCEQIFARHGIRSLRYDGKMNREAREYTLALFRRPGGPKVILVSIKCGGVGLNLVSANRVINLDLSWNFATESQAYDRVHRLGQEKDVHVKRYIIRDSIEESMLRLQETKIHLADAALGEGSGVKLHALSVRQIKDLFRMSQDPRQTRLDQHT
ncbi:SNF2 family N-terminal domain-containing protein [Trametes punicea]|nr:SNF2 family N-terminal domain-containing protein [Trametes punicea]